MLRRTLFPFQHDPYPWAMGRDETNTEVLKSLMATYVYGWEVERLKDLEKDPADFTRNLYQPELGQQSSEWATSYPGYLLLGGGASKDPGGR